MRKLLLLTSLLLFQCAKRANNELTSKERDFAINHLIDSKDNLLNSINDLNHEQLHFKIDESTWSIAECLEHITLMENEVFAIVQESLELPPNPERRKDLKFSNEELIAHVTNRKDKTKTQEEFEPRGKFDDSEAAIKEFKIKREEHISYLKTTKADLHNHFANFGTIDAYQVYLYMSAHTNRHTSQVEEIKNNEKFPKK